MLHVRTRKTCDFFPPVVRRKIQVHGANEVADAAALVSFFDAGPEAVELGAQQVRLVEQYGRVRKEIEDGAVGAGHWSVKLPAGKNRDSAGANRGLDYLFRAFNSFSRKPGMNCTQKLIADRSLGERQK